MYVDGKVGQGGARVDKHGERCVQCNHRFNRISNRRQQSKPKKYVSSYGHICQLCYNHNRDYKPVHVAASPRRTKSAPASLSPVQQSKLFETMKKAGIGQQGRTRSVEDNARALLLVNTLREMADMSYDKAIKTTAYVEQTSSRLLRSAQKRLERKDSLIRSPYKRKITRNNPQHAMYAETGAPFKVHIELINMMKQTQEENRYISLTTIRLALHAKFNKMYAKSTLHHWMTKELNMEYGELKWSPLEESFTNARIRSYILSLAAALKEEEKGTAVIVYMDESYIHQGQRTRFSWYHCSTNKNKKKSNTYKGQGSNSGKRIIVLHAMTKDGMLTMPDVDPSNILSEEYLSCALVFAEVNVDDITPADYHNSINGEKFVMWMQNRLIPTFKARYPDKKMYLVLDNAKYHHHRGEDWITPSKMNLGQCARFLRENAIQQITITTKNTQYVVQANKFSADRRDGGPTMSGIRDAVKTYLLSHPGINTTVPHQLMSDAKFALIYTPPYESWLQPIELIWARMKHTVNTQAYHGRTHQETAAQTYASFDRIDAELCSKLLAHVRKLIDNWLKSDAAGSLSRFGSMSAIMAATKSEIESVNDLYVEDTAVIGDTHDNDDDEKENV